MNYFQDLDAWLTAVLIITEDDEDEEQWFARVKKQIKDKVLESYRNGQKAGLSPEKADTRGEEKPQLAPPTKRKFWPPRAGSRSRPQ